MYQKLQFQNKQLMDKKQGQHYKALTTKYRNFNDDRTKQEVELSYRLTRALAQVNLARLNAPLQVTQRSCKKNRKEDFLYVHCFGSPPDEKQLQHISFPGQTVWIMYTPRKRELSEEETKKQPATYKQWAIIMEEKINQASTTKPVILVFHSFGTQLISAYLYFFPKNRVIGMVDIGGFSFRFLKPMKEMLVNVDHISLKDLENNLDKFYNTHISRYENKLQNGKKVRDPFSFSNKYQFLALMKNIKNEYGIDMIYEQNKNWPPILKCFIYGRKDKIIPESQFSEKAVYYCYQKWDENYRRLVQNAYERLTGKRQDNVQERFVFNIENGSHSLHMQKENKDIIGKILNLYFCMIEEIYALSEAKL